jgi:hypothetical protein
MVGQMTKEELYKLTAKYLNETLSAEEKERLEQWYCQNTDEEITIDLMISKEVLNQHSIKSNKIKMDYATVL